MSLLFSGNQSNISSGGQVYDRTTGTWAGENKGSVGDGMDHGYGGYPAKVWHDANGISGVELGLPLDARLSQRVNAVGEPVAAHQVTNGVPGKGSAGGRGAGSALVVSGMPGTVWWEKVGEASAVVGSRVKTKNLPPLQPVMKGDNTAIQIGGMPFMPQPGTSNASEIEDMLGDGDSPLELAWYFKQAAALSHIDYNIGLWANDPATHQWAKDIDAGIVDFVTSPWW